MSAPIPPPETPPRPAPRRPPRGTPGNLAPKPWTLERALAFTPPFGRSKGEPLGETIRRDVEQVRWYANQPACRNLATAARMVLDARAAGTLP